MIAKIKKKMVSVLAARAKKRKQETIMADVERNEGLMNCLKNNIKFKDIHKGERCFILGNGPSLKEQDLSCLKNEILFTVNQFMRADYANVLHSSYHFWADPAFFSNDDVNSTEIMDLMLSAHKETITFFDSIGYDFVMNNGIDKKIQCSFFKTGLSIFDSVSTEFDGLVSNCATIVQYAVLLAIYMGFSEIYLLGCDMTGIVTMIQAKENEALSGGYSYEMSITEKQRVSNLASRVSMESQFFGWGRMCAGYRILGEYCKQHDILLANSTHGGVLDNLPRVALESLF